MSKNLLTIDWDFFIDASLEERTYTFPRIVDGEWCCIPDNTVWDTLKIKSKLFKQDLSNIISAIFSMNSIFNTFYVSENHGEAYNVFKKCGGFKSVTNIDFHHDMYLGTSHLCCDNWCTILKSKYNFDYYWVKRPDSITTTFGEEVNARVLCFDRVINNLKSGYYDVIHLCRSDLYSPPKFDQYFDYLMSTIKNKSTSFELLGHDLSRR